MYLDYSSCQSMTLVLRTRKKYENEEEKKIRVSYLLEKQNNQLKKNNFH